MTDLDKRFSLLSKMLAEETSSETSLDADVDQIVNHLYAQADEDLMRALERVPFSGAYATADNVKNLLATYRLLLYFPELAGKTIVGLYHAPDCTLPLLKALGLPEQKFMLFFERTWIPEDILCIFTARDGDIQFLNLPENLQELTQKEYWKVQELSKNQFDIHSLITLLSIPLNNDRSDMAVAVIPKPSVTSVNRNTLMAYLNAIVVHQSDYADFLADYKAGLFPGLTSVYVYGGEEAEDTQNTQKIQDTQNAQETQESQDAQDTDGELQEQPSPIQEMQVKTVPDTNAVIAAITSIDAEPLDNMRLSEQIEVQINRPLVFLADRIADRNEKFSLINNDILGNSDAKVVEDIKAYVRDQVKSARDTDTDIFKKLYAVRKAICATANELEQAVGWCYLMDQDPSIQWEEGVPFPQDKMPNMLPFIRKVLDQQLFLQYASFLKIDSVVHIEPDNGIWKATQQYSDAIAQLGNQYAQTVELARQIVSGTKSSLPAFERLLSEETPVYDPFLVRLQIKLGMSVTDSVGKTRQKKILDALVKKIPCILDSCETGNEYFLAGLHYAAIGEEQKAAACYQTALDMGCTMAGDKLMELQDKRGKLSCEELNKLAQRLVPAACERLGGQLISSDNSDDGIIYLKIAASSGSRNAIRELMQSRYNVCRKLIDCRETDSNAFQEAAKETIQYLETLIQTKANKTDQEKAGTLFFYLKDYQNAILYLEAAESDHAFVLLGKIYEEGLGVAKDREAALNWYAQANSQEGAANFDRLTAIWAEEKQKNIASYSKSYAPSYYYYYYYSGYYDSGCVAAGTSILLADGTSVPVEQIQTHMNVLNCRGELSCTSDELIINDTVKYLYAVNGDRPFMSLEHAILTKKGWRSLAPELSMEINPNYHVEMLEIGDQFVKARYINGKFEYIPCIVEKINVVPNKERVICYDLHFYDGYNSYYANGYPCLLNYPELTLAALRKNLAAMTEEQQSVFRRMVEQNRDVLSAAFGRTNLEMLWISGF